jgi:hypothetical protein
MIEEIVTPDNTKKLTRKQRNELLRAQFRAQTETIEEDVNTSPVSALVSSHRSTLPKLPNNDPSVTAPAASSVEPSTAKVIAEAIAEPEKNPDNTVFPKRVTRTQGITIFAHDQDALDALMTFAIESKLRVGRAGPSLFYAVGLHETQKLIQSNPELLRQAIREMATKRGNADQRGKRKEQH